MVKKFITCQLTRRLTHRRRPEFNYRHGGAFGIIAKFQTNFRRPITRFYYYVPTYIFVSDNISDGDFYKYDTLRAQHNKWLPVYRPTGLSIMDDRLIFT